MLERNLQVKIRRISRATIRVWDYCGVHLAQASSAMNIRKASTT